MWEEIGEPYSIYLIKSVRQWNNTENNLKINSMEEEKLNNF